MKISEENPAAPGVPAREDAGGEAGFPPLCIVGSGGKMGRLFLRECARAGYAVRGLAQSLNFTISAAFFCALARHEGIEPFLTPSFKRHLEAARKHLTVDTDMFCAFTAMNPEYPKALARYQAILEEALAGDLARIAAEAAVWYAESP
jgi:prephenate dehydrogenase